MYLVDFMYMSHTHMMYVYLYECYFDFYLFWRDANNVIM